MEQKINPLSFRLGTTQKHHSFWFVQPKNYSEEIQKEIDMIHIIIHIGFPNLLPIKGEIKELDKDLQKEINYANQRFNISIEKVKEPYRQPNILAEYIAFQLKIEFHSERQ
ncbi:unnamed protein product [Triticum turgidum subsp. durum]|uniref:Ribosomal protein S3 n=1 Tax=Triticum turgidum subsp. durum TaxID=4567 RepID=A0A9R1BNP0_TRITD|nr:unnamed protein product [Triticum turgidum subsp. durum]